MSDCSICTTNASLKLGGKSKFVSNTSIRSSARANIGGIAQLITRKIDQLSFVKTSISAQSNIRTNPVFSLNVRALENIENGKIVKSFANIDGALRCHVKSEPSLINKYTNKFAGYLQQLSSLKNFGGVQKLYPKRDIISSLNNSHFVNELLSSGNLYSSIDEGIFTGNYNEHLNKGYKISDDNISYIQPSSVYTQGTFRYKCEVSRPYHHPKHSFLFLRAAAPLSNYGSKSPPEYKISNIKLEDPSGNIIIKYKDVALKGDADYSDSPVINYCTYISEPELNNANLYTWETNYPILNEASGYTLSMDFDIFCLDDPFAQGFDFGYEEKACEVKFVDTENNDYLSLDGSPLSTQTQGYHLNPTNTIRISAIEICNSGDLCGACSISGIKYDNRLSFYTEVNPIGQRISRTIYPAQVLLNSFDIGIYPSASSIWQSSPDDEGFLSYNTSVSGSQVLTSRLVDGSQSSNISLLNSIPTNDSGRLSLKFSHQPPQPGARLVDGAFSWGFISNQVNQANLKNVADVDNFFVVDSIELRVTAKKAINSRDYVLDIVGYSDDRILNVTPKVGGFLQNKHQVYNLTDNNNNVLLTESGDPITIVNESVGIVPIESGFKSTNDIGFANESLSEKDQYFERYLTSIDAGDHYKLSTLPVINSTSYKEYVIPLEIYEDRVDVGKSIDYSMSSYFENLYLDLYPIPSGASISDIKLIVYYRPSNGMTLHTFGTPSTKELNKKDITLLPVGRTKLTDISTNSDYTAVPLSTISGIPHGYSENATLKTNYSRRWRGVDGNIVNGPYNPDEFDFSFFNPTADHPFLNGLFDFNNVQNNFVLARNHPYFSNNQGYPAYSGYYNGNSPILKNIGLRFKNQQLFTNKTTDYTTIDWANNNDPLYGKICDSFDNAIRVSGAQGNINFGNIPITSGFACYIRFTPDESISGVNYNLFNSGVLISKWDSGSNNEFTLGYDSGRLCVRWKDLSGINRQITDSKFYYQYQYPLSVLVNYTVSRDGNISLFCNDELTNTTIIRASQQTALSSGNSNLVVGHSFGSGVGIRAFIHEIGLSTPTNIFPGSVRPKSLKQITIQSLFESHSHSFFKLLPDTKYSFHKYIDDNVSSWKLGDFKICSFSPDFDAFTTRIGSDYLIHYLKHHGSGYNQITNKPLPSSIITSGVCYHTQIENDFLRLNLQDIPDVNPEFYSSLPRICKTLPRGYDFVENAFVVDTIIEHDSLNNIYWSDGSIGPKLIVSLYSKNKNPVDRPSKQNWGLINRSIHYLEPSGCYRKISSTFNYNDLIDTSEPWALFDLDNIRSEFDQKYYSNDINDMFLQYDLVYPSGPAFESTIKIHSVNVRLDDTLTYFANNNNKLNLYASGQAISYSDLNLFVHGLSYANNLPNGLSLCSIGSAWPNSSGGISLNVPGALGIRNNTFNLFVKNAGSISRPSTPIFGSLFGSEPETYPEIICYVFGGEPRDEQTMNLVMTNNYDDQHVYNSLPIFLDNRIPEYQDSSLSLSVDSYAIREFKNSASMGLTTLNDGIIIYSTNSQADLFIQVDDVYTPSSGTFNLYSVTYFAYNQKPGESAVISWNKNDLGTAIDAIIDADVPYLEANDEIRGVELICYGDCNSNKSCKENPVYLHDLIWYDNDDTCVDGGIFRAKNVYNNPTTSGFKTSTGYDGHFYGIRKYEGLVPHAPYNITIQTKSGSSQSVALPNNFIEMDYGSNSYVDYSGIKFTANNQRASENKYGKSVAVKYDLMVVGSPMSSESYSEYDISGNLQTTTLSEAGSLYLYRRNPRPVGPSWPQNQHKSDWILEEKLTLPSGVMKDYANIVRTNELGNITLPDQISIRYWNVGQEGRQLGHSVDIGINKDLKSFQSNQREVIVAGGPSAKWSRDFEDLNASGVSIGLLIFTDEFFPVLEGPKDYTNVLNAISNKDLVFEYFCSPPVKFNIKLIICEPLADDANITPLEFDEPRPSFITKKTIPRNKGIVDESDTAAIFSGIKSAFEEAFPYDPTKLNNNAPVMMGIYVDNSRSLGRSAIEPGLDRFINYYRQYSFDNGVTDFYGVRSSGSVYEYNSEFDNAEDWVNISTTLLDELLDTGRLLVSNDIRYFASGVGPNFVNEQLSVFNVPPPSGGRVYVFEKESGVWNLVQEIQSPVVSYDTLDRFGHSVAISEDTSIIAVGSPYIGDCCKVYEYKPEEKQRLFDNLASWLPHQSSLVGGTSVRYIQLISNYEQWLNQYGPSYANEILYSKLTPTERFQARKYLNISEYQNIFTYGYGNIPYVGTWGEVIKRFIPTSRLGYSVSVNDDGSAVAFGAPTDSLNVFDDLNVYYNDGENPAIYDDPTGNINGIIKSAWSSNVNAGAIRLFESRNYYPHDSIVEFGKFGNLQQSLNYPEDSGHFDYIKHIFSDKNFRKMSEEEVAIPKEAGLAFIITPGEDALSDEVVDNIKSWLALGDRNLVLVGNDPIWEENGLYQKSNDIINRLLDRLGSNLRLHPARNQQESLPTGYAPVLPSFRPANGTSTYINSFNMKTASGVADIRMNIPGTARYMPCKQTTMDGDDLRLNSKCELPLTHNGDLRAQWYEWCSIPYKPYMRIYPVNWPYIYGTWRPLDCMDGEDAFADLLEETGPNAKTPGKDPIPLLVAAETKTIVRTDPAIPEISKQIAIYNPIYGKFVTQFIEEELYSVPSFVWDSGNPSGYASYESNLNKVVNNSQWYVPFPVEERYPILQNKAEPITKPTIGSEFITDKALFCVQQNHVSNFTSKIIAIAGTETESREALYGQNASANINDRNVSFYVNMVSERADGRSIIAQLGGWTGRTSFVDAYQGSILRSIFVNTGNDVSENVTNLEVFGSQSRFNICWIANPLNIPGTNELNELKAWLNLGNKKLIITHDNTLSQMLIVAKILELLNTNIKPLYLPVKEEYPLIDSDLNIEINPIHPISVGFNVQRYKISNFYASFRFYPFASAVDVLPVGYVNLRWPIYDDKIYNLTYFRMNSGVDKITFPAVANSGYKIFISYVKEYPSENVPIDIYFNNVSEYPELPLSPKGASATIQETVNDDPYVLGYNIFKQISPPILNEIITESFNVQVGSSANEIEMYINTLNPRIENVSYIPKTPRILSISGVPIPVRQVKTFEEVIGWEFDRYETVITQEAQPERTVVLNVDGPIASLNDRYCQDEDCFEAGLNGQLIEDGPVVAAQEMSFITPFNAGVARSRITIISDSNLVQGRYMVDEFGRMSEGTVGFIRSLYPLTDFPSSNSGRQYTEFTKIVAPERGSPQKYLAINNLSGIKSRFTPFGSPKQLSYFNDKESLYNPKYIVRPKEYWKNYPPEKRKQFIDSEIQTFESQQQNFGASATMFSGIVNSQIYFDAGLNGGIPRLLHDTGSDYLDIDRFPSGYPGDLFGYSISMHKNKLVVGSPFSAFSDENINPWAYYVTTGGQSGIQLASNGGAGSVYVYEKTFKGSGVSNTTVPWQFMQKLRPNSINAGQDLSDSGSSQIYSSLGPHTYNNNYLSQFTTMSDQFGYDVSIDSDVIVVGAPGHDFGNYTNSVYNSGCFIRKSFNPEFDIPSRVVIDLGNSGIRNSVGSGLCVLNNGAIFAFENNINDWPSRSKKWILVEKVTPQGNSRQQNVNENDNFGRSVYVHRSLRSDADYTIACGSENHDYSSSGTNQLSNAGAVYSHDIMLREFAPAKANANTYIDVKVFGERLENLQPTVRVITSNAELDKVYETKGLIYSDKYGSIFLEASGQDPTTKGFVQHRPYVISIDGLYAYGSGNTNELQLYVGGKNVDISGIAYLFTDGTTGNVYNNLGLYSSSIVDFGSGILNFYNYCPDPITIFNSGLPFMVSGIGIGTDKLNLRIRGY